ncbi:EDD domain protein [Paenibacillus yonginensis]|uniref:EDD domain protein n=1 Tax=Paenibacillus yonginensis TaxID=1462996 RepID=A0A1B1N0Q5_9BACL|nr:DegV family protein [Paenibacillus yonginensis]ANS74986.1 EDD domain protein [Paenibacillus yonginensis]
MAKPVIVTDSTADVPKSIVEAYGIHVIPMVVRFGEDSYREGIDLTAGEFYERLEREKELPTTSQTSPSQYMEVFRGLLEANPDSAVISIHLSSGMSGTYQASMLGKEMLEEELGHPVDVHVVDSRCASYGFGMLVTAAARMAEEGADTASILKEVERLRQVRHLYFMVDTLEYLQKGGRIGRATALLGTLLNIKPILSVGEDGVIYSVDKARGRKKAIARMMELFRKDFGEVKDIHAALADSANPEGAEEILAELRNHFTLHEVVRTDIGAVVGAHVGRGTVAVFCWPARD